jgi:hypothetical protein
MRVSWRKSAIASRFSPVAPSAQSRMRSAHTLGELRQTGSNKGTPPACWTLTNSTACWEPARFWSTAAAMTVKGGPVLLRHQKAADASQVRRRVGLMYGPAYHGWRARPVCSRWRAGRMSTHRFPARSVYPKASRAHACIAAGRRGSTTRG